MGINQLVLPFRCCDQDIGTPHLTDILVLSVFLATHSTHVAEFQLNHVSGSVSGNRRTQKPRPLCRCYRPPKSPTNGCGRPAQMYRGIFRIIRTHKIRNSMTFSLPIPLTAYAATHMIELELGDMSTINQVFRKMMFQSTRDTKKKKNSLFILFYFYFYFIFILFILFILFIFISCFFMC